MKEPRAWSWTVRRPELLGKPWWFLVVSAAGGGGRVGLGDEDPCVDLASGRLGADCPRECEQGRGSPTARAGLVPSAVQGQSVSEEGVSVSGPCSRPQEFRSVPAARVCEALFPNQEPDSLCLGRRLKTSPVLSQ